MSKKKKQKATRGKVKRHGKVTPKPAVETNAANQPVAVAPAAEAESGEAISS